MAIKKVKTIAEYAIRRWMEEQGFEMEYFQLTINGNEGKLEDWTGDTMLLVYDPESKAVHVKGD